MLDLDNEPKLPEYEIQYHGKVKKYDPLVVGFKLRELAGVEDPEVIHKAVVTIFELDPPPETTFAACCILHNFEAFIKEELDETLKKVFGRSPFSVTTTDSPQPKSES